MLHVKPTLRLSIHSRRTKQLSRAFQQPCRNLLTLAIETSCDDTAVAILEKDSPSENITTTPNPSEATGQANQDIHHASPPKRPQARLLFNEKITAPNTGLGGIHPIEALASHQANLSKLVSRAIESLPVAGTSPGHAPTRSLTYANDTTKRLPDFISVTRGPGMRSNLHCGLDTAKGLSVAWQVPLVGVHHMQAHALTPRLVSALENGRSDSTRTSTNDMEGTSDVDFPFLTLLVSGGHTMLLHSRGLTDHKILATTADVAIGDALDKSGRMILPEEIRVNAKDTAYAKHLSDFAFPTQDTYHMWPVPKRRQDEIRKPDNVFGWQIQAPFADTKKMGFSFASIPSTVEKIMQKRSGQMKNNYDLEERRTLGRTAIGIAFEHLASRTVIALESLHSQSAKQKQTVPISSLVVSGGVAANPFLRFFLRAMLDVRGFSHVKLVFPPPWLCTDNAAMIAWCGMEMYEAGFRSELSIDARRKWSMDCEAQDGGILGVGGWIRAGGG